MHRLASRLAGRVTHPVSQLLCQGLRDKRGGRIVTAAPGVSYSGRSIEYRLAWKAGTMQCTNINATLFPPMKDVL